MELYNRQVPVTLQPLVSGDEGCALELCVWLHWGPNLMPGLKVTLPEFPGMRWIVLAVHKRDWTKATPGTRRIVTRAYTSSGHAKPRGRKGIARVEMICAYPPCRQPFLTRPDAQVRHCSRACRFAAQRERRLQRAAGAGAPQAPQAGGLDNSAAPAVTV